MRTASQRISLLRTPAFHVLMLASIAAIVLPVCARAQPGTDHQEIMSAAEGERLTVKGKVTAVDDERFTVDYGRGNIVVEMDDFDRYEKPVAAGDVVIVSGNMDKEFFEARKIKASTVRVDSSNKQFHASAADEARWPQLEVLHDDVADDEWLSLTGVVARIDGDRMTLNAGLREYAVDVSRLGYDPFNREGTARIETGERVIVFGEMDDADLFEGREIEASSITELSGR